MDEFGAEPLLLGLRFIYQRVTHAEKNRHSYPNHQYYLVHLLNLDVHMLRLEVLFDLFVREYEKLSHGAKPKKIGTYIAQRLSDVETRQKRVALLQKALYDLRKDYDNKCETTESQIRALQSNCMHESTHYHEDPSGNGDSETHCDICHALL